MILTVVEVEKKHNHGGCFAYVHSNFCIKRWYSELQVESRLENCYLSWSVYYNDVGLA